MIRQYIVPLTAPIFLVYSETGIVLTQMGTGDFFGEIGILNLDGGINRYLKLSLCKSNKIVLVDA